MTYALNILKTVNDTNNWVVSHQLEKVNTLYGWIGTRGTRTCRDLESRGLLEKSLTINSPYVSYKITQEGKEVISQANSSKTLEAVSRNNHKKVPTSVLYLRSQSGGEESTHRALYTQVDLWGKTQI